MALLSGIKNNVLVLGLVSFFTDVSSEMVFPILPLFLASFLGAGKEAIGLIEGIADSVSSLMDIFFGYWSDRIKSRKNFVILGYGLSSLVKIGIAFSTAWQQVLVFRGAERVGKSIRTSPRDALIAESASESVRGKAFGLHRALDTLGAIAGPALAYVVLSAMGSTESAYRTVFQLALIPAFIAVALIIILVREPKPKQAAPAKAKRPSFFQSLKMLSPAYKRFLAISCIFSLSYFSFALFIVRASDLGVSAGDILLMYLLYNVVYALSSMPIGSLSDKIGRKPVIAGAFALYGLICLGFAFASAGWHAAFLFAFYGLFVAADESVNKAYVSDMTDKKTRGIALGAYNTSVGAAYLPANALFGAAWAALGPVAAFGSAAVIAALAGLLMLTRAK